MNSCSLILRTQKINGTKISFKTKFHLHRAVEVRALHGGGRRMSWRGPDPKTFLRPNRKYPDRRGSHQLAEGVRG